MVNDRLFKHWTAEEDRLLLELAETTAYKDLARQLNRTYGAVQQRLSILRQRQRESNGNGNHPPKAEEPDKVGQELAAMRAVADALQPLTASAQERVLRWAMTRVDEG